MTEANKSTAANDPEMNATKLGCECETLVLRRQVNDAYRMIKVIFSFGNCPIYMLAVG